MKNAMKWKEQCLHADTLIAHTYKFKILPDTNAIQCTICREYIRLQKSY